MDNRQTAWESSPALGGHTKRVVRGHKIQTKCNHLTKKHRQEAKLWPSPLLLAGVTPSAHRAPKSAGNGCPHKAVEMSLSWQAQGMRGAGGGRAVPGGCRARHRQQLGSAGSGHRSRAASDLQSTARALHILDLHAGVSTCSMGKDNNRG